MHKKGLFMTQKALQEYVVEKESIEHDVSTLKKAPYNWFNLLESLPIEWMPYCEFLKEHSRELANGINEFGRYIVSLQAWKTVLNRLNNEERPLIVLDFIAPLATLCLNLPYALRSRFIYSIAHLSHQANRLWQYSWVDNLPIDEEICFEQADSYGRPWKKYTKLKVALEKISNTQYRKATHNFRNKYNHRYSPRIEIGMTELVKRNVNANGEVNYTIGFTKPLMLEDIIPLLKEQHHLCLLAFEKYQQLINEQLAMITKRITSRSS